MRLAYLGTPDFAVPALRALHGAGYEIAAVYCQPPRPAGRGQTERRCPVQCVAEELGLAVRTPERLRGDADVQAAFAELGLDVAVVAAYGQILPRAMLAAPRLGCLNIHASLLPRWRGASPIAAAIRAGDAESGVTIMQMEAGLDTGPMLAAETVPITPATTGAILHDQLATLSAPLILRVLADPPPPVVQPADGVTYAKLLRREDGIIDWTNDAASILRQIRAYDPWPGTQTRLDGTVLKIGDAEIAPVETLQPAGTVLDARLTVACGTDADGRPTALRLLRLQRPGRAMMPADAYQRGQPIAPLTRLG